MENNQKKKYESTGNEPVTDKENTKITYQGNDGVRPSQLADDLFLEKIDSLYSAKSLKINENQKKHISDIDSRQEIIIGTDERVKSIETEYPYRNIALLEIYDSNNEKYFGTGFFISKRCVVTAGHCVYFKKKWVKKIKVIPGARGTVEPFGSTISSRFRSVSGWTSENNTNFDYGAIILDDDSIYNNINSYFGYGVHDNQNQIELSGYPSDKLRTQWKSLGIVSKRSKYRIYYDLDTVRGNSGSPIYISDGSKKIVIGLHSFGQNPNYSIRINQEIINRWTEWSNL